MFFQVLYDHDFVFYGEEIVENLRFIKDSDWNILNFEDGWLFYFDGRNSETKGDIQNSDRSWAFPMISV